MEYAQHTILKNTFFFQTVPFRFSFSQRYNEPVVMSRSHPQQLFKTRKVISDLFYLTGFHFRRISPEVYQPAFRIIIIHNEYILPFGGGKGLGNLSSILGGSDQSQAFAQVLNHKKIGDTGIGPRKSGQLLPQFLVHAQTGDMPFKHAMKQNILDSLLEYIAEHSMLGRQAHESGVVAGNEIPARGYKKEILSWVGRMVNKLHNPKRTDFFPIHIFICPTLADNMVDVHSRHIPVKTVIGTPLIHILPHQIAHVIFNARQPSLLEGHGGPDNIPDVPACFIKLGFMINIGRNNQDDILRQSPEECLRFHGVFRNGNTAGIYVYRLQVTAGDVQHSPEFTGRRKHSMLNPAFAVAERLTAGQIYFLESPELFK